MIYYHFSATSDLPSVSNARSWPGRPLGVWAYTSLEVGEYAKTRPYLQVLESSCNICNDTEFILDLAEEFETDPEKISEVLLAKGFQAVQWTPEEIVFLKDSAFKRTRVVELK